MSSVSSGSSRSCCLVSVLRNSGSPSGQSTTSTESRFKSVCIVTQLPQSKIVQEIVESALRARVVSPQTGSMISREMAESALRAGVASSQIGLMFDFPPPEFDLVEWLRVMLDRRPLQSPHIERAMRTPDASPVSIQGVGSRSSLSEDLSLSDTDESCQEESETYPTVDV